MKNLIFSIFCIFLFVLAVNSQDSLQHRYTQTAHQWLVSQAWEYLKHEKPNVNWNSTYLSSHIGTWETGDVDDPWAETHVVSGAWMEDENDPVYGYGFPSATSTHFWRADQGVDWQFCEEPCPPFCGCYPNAYQKATKYVYGGHRMFFAKSSVDPYWGAILGRYYSYDNLFDFFNTGHCYYWGHMDLAGNYVEEYNPPLELNINAVTAKDWSMLILGRVAHLLGDMGVPAHANGTQHDPFWSGTDAYEQYMGNAWSNYNWQSATSGIGPLGILENSGNDYRLKYLFYLTSQYANRFADDHRPGNNNYYQIDPENGSNYGIYLNPFYAYVTNESYSAPQCCVTTVGNWCYPFAIRTIASLLYWFAINTNQFPPVAPTNLTVTTNLPGVQTNGYNLYRNTTGTFTANSNGTQLNYLWYYYICGSSTPAYWPLNSYSLQTLNPNNIPQFKIRNNNYVFTSCPTALMSAPTTIYLRTKLHVWNSSGDIWSPEYKIFAQENPPTGGCPYVYVNTHDSEGNSIFAVDNNILHRSEFTEYANQDIKDLYKLTIQPDVIDGKISLQLAETEYDYNYFDNVKLYAVDHPVGTKIGVTESNDIIMYDDNSVTSTDGATLNQNSNITEFIQYNHQGKKIVTGLSSDNIYAHYDTTTQYNIQNKLTSYNHSFKGGNIYPDSVALIGELSRLIYYPAVKDYAGFVDIYGSRVMTTKPFSRRENLSTVVIPYSGMGDAVEHIEINWNDDFTVTYFSVVPIYYSGFNVTEATLYSATHTTWENILPFLNSIDNISAEMDTSAVIDLRFNEVNRSDDMLRDYVLEVNGRYTTPPIELIQNRVINTDEKPVYNNQPKDYKLYMNYPNPFNPKTTIKYDIPRSGNVKIEVYDILGKLVTELINGYQNPGTYEVTFDGTNYSSGIYIYKITSNNYIETKKMVLIK